MGLKERRLAEKIKIEEFTPFQQELNSIAGTPIAVTVDWDSFTQHDEYPLSRLKNNVFDPLIGTFTSLCRDQMGKDAVRENIASITATNVLDPEQVGVTFEDKTVTVKVTLHTDAYYAVGESEMITLLESKL